MDMFRHIQSAHSRCSTGIHTISGPNDAITLGEGEHFEHKTRWSLLSVAEAELIEYGCGVTGSVFMLGLSLLLQLHLRAFDISKYRPIASLLTAGNITLAVYVVLYAGSVALVERIDPFRFLTT